MISPWPSIPLSSEHGGPVRTVVPGRYFYKSLKWLKRIELLAEDCLGYWEAVAGYHNHADYVGGALWDLATIVEPLDPVTHASDARDLVGACLEHRAEAMLLDAKALSPVFFELRSGLAGELLQKLENYRIRAALVVPDERRTASASPSCSARAGAALASAPSRAAAKPRRGSRVSPTAPGEAHGDTGPD